MICSKCGREYSDVEKVCPYCGEETPVEVKTVSIDTIGSTQNNTSVLVESQTMGILAIVFSCLGGCWLGLVFTIVGFVQYKQPEGRKKCVIALIIFIAWFFIGLIGGYVLAMLGYEQV